MKNKQKLKIKNKKLSIVIIFVVIILLVFTGVYFIFNLEDTSTNLTLIEKQWIEKNKTSLYDFKVPSNLSILSSDGKGVFFDYLDLVEESGISINKVAYTYPTKYSDDGVIGIYVLKNTDEAKNTDIYIMNDYYVILGKSDSSIKSDTDINGKNVGVLTTDSDYIKSYYGNNINIKTYDSTNDLYNAIGQDVDYAIATRYQVLSDVSTNENVSILFSLSNLTNKIVLRLGNDEKLNSIVSKYMEKFINDSLNNSINSYLMKLYVKSSKVTDVEKATLTSKVIKYGFVNDDSYNSIHSSILYGFAGEYINVLSSMADISFEYVPYKDYDALNEGLNNGEVDIAFANTSSSYKEVNGSFSSSYVVLSNNYETNASSYSLSGRNVYVLENSELSKYLNDNYKIGINNCKNIPKSLNNFDLIAVDESYYEYYTAVNGNDYKVLFKDNYTSNYKFVVKDGEDVLLNITNYVMSSIDSNSIKEIAINKLNDILNKNQKFKSIYLCIILIIIIPFVFIIIITNLKKYANNSLGNKKEDVLMYNDMLTSLKNRNYLNANVNFWDNTKVFPRTIIIIDLNNLKYVNDNYGHEEGNTLIKKAAAILISTQLEKSEIVRTDGNEFLIYLIGYNKTQIDTYISKLSKEFENLPHGFGAAIGYSMITDEIKTIDDAINEATIDMRIDKEQNYK